jgi:PAS domain S-box-containing protein
VSRKVEDNDTGAFRSGHARSTQDTLIASELRIAAEAAKLGLWSWDLQSGQVVWNNEMHELTGYAVPLSLPDWIERLAHPDDRDRLKAATSSLGQPQLEPQISRIVRGGGEVRWVLMSGRVMLDPRGVPSMILGACMDVTEHQNATDRLQQAEQLASVGYITAGVAHNFNNMLMVIIPCLQTLKGAVAASEHQELITDALDASQRAAGIVRQLMLISGQSNSVARRQRRLGEIAAEVVRLCRRAVQEGIALELEVLSDGLIECEEGAIEQVLSNLILNARDALVDGNIADPRIRLWVEREKRFGAQWVNLVIQDNGPGIPDHLTSKIFDPFFTTRTGRGTGLGLSTAQAFVSRHEGQLACRSRPGRTEFLLLLPICSEAAAPAPEASATPATQERQRVLVIDDEPAVRRVVQLSLQGAGFDVISAANSEGVRNLFPLRPPADVVLLDRTLGHESGSHLVGLLRVECPNARILYFTGQHIEADDALQVDGVVQKPIGREALVQAIRAVVGSN